jgi:hypothetical protein
MLACLVYMSSVRCTEGWSGRWTDSEMLALGCLIATAQGGRIEGSNVLYLLRFYQIRRWWVARPKRRQHYRPGVQFSDELVLRKRAARRGGGAEEDRVRCRRGLRLLRSPATLSGILTWIDAAALVSPQHAVTAVSSDHSHAHASALAHGGGLCLRRKCSRPPRSPSPRLPQEPAGNTTERQGACLLPYLARLDLSFLQVACRPTANNMAS